MIRRYKLGRAEQRVPHLLRLLGHQGMGTLVYEEKGNPVQSFTGISCHHLATLALQAEKFEEAPASMADDELAMLFQAGSSPGGARPKALISDEKGAYLVKFASTKDHLDVVSLEAAAIKLARQAGLETAETRNFGIKHRQQASDIFTEVYDGVAEWASIFDACQVPEKDAIIIGKDIQQRMGKVANE